MIRHAADGLWNTVQGSDHSAKISVQTLSPRPGNYGFVVLGSKNKMIVKAQMSGWHNAFLSNALSGLILLLYCNRWFTPPANLP
jgi:hypothetical protein